MEHGKYIEWNTLSVYGELQPEEQSELLHHLLSCKSCLDDFEEKRKLKNEIPLNFNEPDETLLNSARLNLKVAIEEEKNKSSFLSVIAGGITPFVKNYYKYAAAAVILIAIGLFSGKLLFETKQGIITTPNGIIKAKQTEGSMPENTQITNVKFVDSDPSDGKVEFSFDAIKQVHVKGNINDPDIQNILTHAMLYEQNPGIRLNSISAIEKSQPDSLDKDVKEALISVIKNDHNDGVRLEALNLLKKYPYNDDTKKAFLFVLKNDKNSAMRIAAINSLVEAKREGHSFSKDDMTIFKEKMEKDENKYIQYKAKTVLEEI